jgi:carboxypeptidase family protein/TonB-dependent receptor-like protein
MRGRVASRWSAALLAFALLCGTFVPAAAQSSSDTGIIQITVKDAAAQALLADARVFLLGPIVASALTTKSGIVKYTDVPSGLYRVRVSKSGFAGVTSGQFEVLGNKQVDVDVDLGVRPQQAAQQSTTSTSDNPSGLKVIGSVRARVIVTTTDVDENSAVRKISDSLTDALSSIGGVDVTQDSNDPSAPQTISLRGHDESQTAVTLDGIPLGAPGAATNLRSVNTDLFSGASASFGAQAGSLGGSVNFRTLQPTQTWQSKVAASYGTFDRYNFQIGETGSIGKLGIAVLHTKRAGNNPLTFQEYTDQSGFDYAHGGESANIGDFLKLRYALNDRTTLMATGLQNNQATSALCTQFVTPLPCGIGPNNGNSGKFQFAYGTVQSLIGDTAVTVTGYVNNSTNLTDDLNRYVPGGCAPGSTGTTPVLCPSSSVNGSLARGIAASATLTREKHTFTLSGSTYAGVTTFTPLVLSGISTQFVHATTFGTASRQIQLSDQYKVNDKLTFGPNISYAGTSGAGSSVLAGLSAAWRPVTSDSYTGSVSVGSSQPANGLVRTLSDPYGARVNCFADTAVVNGPGDLPQHQSALSYDASWTHTWTHGQFSLSAYRQSQSGQLVGAQVTADSFGAFPGGYLGAVDTYFSNVCQTPGSAPQVYVQQQIGGTTRVYQGYSATARVGFGPNIVVIPSYSTTGATVTAADPRYIGLDSTLILNSQIPGRPVHTANVTVDALYAPAQLELLASARYVGPNNNQYIAPYTIVNAGLSHALGMGRITVFSSNLFNTESGNFSTLQYAQPIALSGGGFLLQAARPNAPRSYTVTYSFNTGARPGAGYSRGARGSGTTAAAAGSQPPQPRGLGFGQLKFIAPPPGVDPLSLATARPECTAALQPQAQKVLAQLGAAASAFAAGKPVPEVDGLTLTPHGTPNGTWWFGLGPKIPEGVFRNRQGADGGPRAPGPGGPGGPGGEEGGGPGGPGGFQQRVVVAPRSPDASPRPQFSPSPELIAALAPLRAAASCAYGTTFTPAEAKAKGYDVQVGVNVAGPRPSPSPGASPEPLASPAPGTSPAPGASPGPRRGFGSPLNYAPGIGIFVVRAPDLGTGGGSVKQ